VIACYHPYIDLVFGTFRNSATLVFKEVSVSNELNLLLDVQLQVILQAKGWKVNKVLL
jgi:hypothetical protein